VTAQLDRGPSARSDIPPFHAMAMARAAEDRAAGGIDVLHLEVGQPSTPAPKGALEAAHEAMASRALGYTNAPGLPALRQRIARHYGEWYGVEIDQAGVLVTAGASAAFTLAFLACFDAGDRVGIVEPGYPCYRNTLSALGCDPVPIAVGPETRWAPTVEAVAAASEAGRLRGLVVASPSNPTGTVLAPEVLAALAAHCRERAMWLISDEIYHGITFSGPAETALAHDPQAVVVNSFSKYFSMTGWRLGWIVTPPELTAAVERFQQNLYICAPAVSQVAGLAAFECQDELDGHVRRYAEHRHLLLDGLAAAGLTDVAEADGAFYVYADVRELLERTGIADSSALCRRWLDELAIASTPGIDFDLARGDGFVRLSYAGRADDIVEATARLAAWAGA
jgi:aspartate/methionine/tyrosine aminotransferase